MNAVRESIPLRGQLMENHSLKRYNTWRLGGRAEHFFTPADVDDLRLFLKSLHRNKPVTLIGLGSNILVRDGGVSGVVIRTHPGLNHLSSANEEIYAEAGVTCAGLARFAMTQRIGQFEFFCGIPGTLGGALAMNAGCFGYETWQFVKKVICVTRGGSLQTRTPRAFRIGYRQVERRGGNPDALFFVAAYLRPPPDTEVEDADTKGKMKQLLQYRKATQPIGLANAGSVFRNPNGHHAAALIEQCGLKGKRIGGALVSEKHANFIINENASARDIEQLIHYIQTTVYRKTGIELTPEVRLIGDEE